jgi:hypothetical protein
MALGGLLGDNSKGDARTGSGSKNEKIFCQTWIVVWIVLWARSNFFYKSRSGLIIPILGEPAGNLQ